MYQISAFSLTPFALAVGLKKTGEKKAEAAEASETIAVLGERKRPGRPGKNG